MDRNIQLMTFVNTGMLIANLTVLVSLLGIFLRNFFKERDDDDRRY